MCDSFLVVWYYLNSGYAHGQTFVQVQINIALFLERKYCNYFVIESYVVHSYITISLDLSHERMRQSLVLYSMKLAPSCAIRSKKNATKESGRTNLSLFFSFARLTRKLLRRHQRPILKRACMLRKHAGRSADAVMPLRMKT